MDPAVVVDASVWVGRFTPQDVFHLASRQWMAQYIGRGGRLVVPILTLSEVAGAIARRTGQLTLAQQAILDLQSLSVVQIVPLDTGLGTTAANIAATLRLRGADAVY